MTYDACETELLKFFQALPHCQELNMELVKAEPGKATLRLPYDERLIGDPETGVIHGGAVSALMDSCCGGAAMSHPQSGQFTATIGLRIDYMRPATAGQAITAEAECYHVTRSVAFVRAVALDEDRGRPVATATGTFTIEGQHGT